MLLASLTILFRKPNAFLYSCFSKVVDLGSVSLIVFAGPARKTFVQFHHNYFVQLTDNIRVGKTSTGKYVGNLQARSHAGVFDSSGISGVNTLPATYVVL
jgi:hypothetical protein